MVQVTFEVPERLLGDFYTAVGAVLEGARLATREPDIRLANGRHGLAGVVAWPSRQCAEVHRVPLFRYEAAEKPGEAGAYWMDPRTAKLFLAARDSHLALRAEARAGGL